MSEFWQAVSEEFGDAYGRSLSRDLILREIGDRTAVQGIEAGVDVREIWLALCHATDVPDNRRYGVGKRPRK